MHSKGRGILTLSISNVERTFTIFVSYHVTILNNSDITNPTTMQNIVLYIAYLFLLEPNESPSLAQVSQ